MERQDNGGENTPEETNVVRVSSQAAGAVDVRGPDGLPPDLSHDVPLPTEVLVTQRQEVVDHKGLEEKPTFKILFYYQLE